MTNTYDVGDVVRIETTTVFTGLDEQPFDPDVVTIKVKAPDGSVDSKAWPDDEHVVRVGEGDFYRDVALDAVGIWRYRIEGTTEGGDLRGADEGSFRVTRSGF